jgi:hypothetical protein
MLPMALRAHAIAVSTGNICNGGGTYDDPIRAA